MIIEKVLTENFLDSIMQTELPGLCTTCINKNECFYRAQASKIILQCELFETSAIAYTPMAHMSVIEQKNENYNSRKGLCGNCVNESGCQLPRNHGGVWHCEEYN